jgi:hypothetical protein
MRSVLGEASADRYLDELVARLRDVLGERLVGAWLVNSAVRDDYLPGRSDLDIAVGATEPLDPATKGRLAGVLRHAALPCPAPRLELVVYRRSVFAAPGGQPPFELNLNSGPAIADHVTTDPMDEPPHWFVLDLSAARERAFAMVGPSLGELMAPIPDAIVIDALRASAAWHHVHDTAAPNRVLNACRAWRWIEQRQWWSKTESGEWAVAAGGDAELIRLALARRRGETRTALPADRVDVFSAALDERLARAAASG